jgi:aminopeptidase N
VAHQWFGDSVTESDWPHIWLSEGFATYLTALYVEHTYGADRFEDLMARNRETVLRFARQTQLPVILDPPPSNLLELLTPNSYQKAGWVLHMLRSQVGTETFWDGLREYYSRFRDGNASTDDFRDTMEDLSGQELEWFFDQWLERPGHPVLDGSWTFDSATRLLEITMSQTQSGTYRVPIEFGVWTSSSESSLRVTSQMDGASQTFAFQLDTDEVLNVQVDPDVRLLMEATFGPR